MLCFHAVQIMLESTAVLSGIHCKIRMFKVFDSGIQCIAAKFTAKKYAKKWNRLQRNSICQWITLHAFQNCRPAKSTAKIQNTYFWHCNEGSVLFLHYCISALQLYSQNRFRSCGAKSGMNTTLRHFGSSKQFERCGF